MITRALAIAAILVAGAASASKAKGPAYPLLDGDCGEYAVLAQARYEVSDAVTLYLFQDRDYVWLCYTLPENSFGMADLVVDAPALDAPLNLHVSAQLGEWPAGKPEAAPASADSAQWWNHRGWTGTTVRFNGAKAELDDAGKPGVDYNFRLSPARELQLSKQRFGRGQWRWHIDIRNVADGKGGQASLRFPKAGEQTLRVE